jgi:two-component system, OmpR family, phosphate regulon sensor histidine kinase PhoR
MAGRFFSTKRTLFRRLTLPILLVTVLSVLVFAAFIASAVQQFYDEQIREDLTARTRMAEHPLEEALWRGDTVELQRLCVAMGRPSGTRITVILPTGRVVGDSEKDPSTMENHADRPEVQVALRGARGLEKRFSHSVGRNLLYLALPLARNGRVEAVVRTSVPLIPLDATIHSLELKLLFAGLVLALLSSLIAYVIARHITRPLADIGSGAERFARGELSFRVPSPGTLELDALARSLNDMARQLDERIRLVTEQRNEQLAVISSMVEGVLVLDPDDVILTVNAAAARLLGIDAETARGRRIQEAVRNTALLRFIECTRGGSETTEEQLLLPGATDLHIQAHGTVLQGSAQQGRAGAQGVVVVLHDLTQQRRLENIRREFVANVSHELKTPITSIKGSVETLQEGALADRGDAERFLAIIARQTDRLHAIIEDLLSLSRIEQEAERSEIMFEVCDGRAVLRGAVQDTEHAATERGIALRLTCDDPLPLRANMRLLEQAVVNLVTNALQYSERGTSVRIGGAREADRVVFRIADEGCGIPAEHLPRIFERFYRVDRARSREAGGTGLGLAIVKHIVQAHGGTVQVESTPGSGSVFTIILPARQEP